LRRCLAIWRLPWSGVSTNCASIGFVSARFGGLSPLPGPCHADRLMPVRAQCRVIDNAGWGAPIVSRLPGRSSAGGFGRKIAVSPKLADGVQLLDLALLPDGLRLGLARKIPDMPASACRFEVSIGARCTPRFATGPATVTSPRIDPSATLASTRHCNSFVCQPRCSSLPPLAASLAG